MDKKLRRVKIGGLERTQSVEDLLQILHLREVFAGEKNDPYVDWTTNTVWATLPDDPQELEKVLHPKGHLWIAKVLE
jgi:hypothetical protein